MSESRKRIRDEPPADSVLTGSSLSSQVTDGNLHVHEETLHCSERGCIACMYKIFPNGTHKTLHLPPNVRPELCRRSKQIHSTARYYHNSYNILTLGDGDLSFSSAVVKLINDSPCNAPSTVIATTHELKPRLLTVYPQFQNILDRLGAYETDVRHGVDATNLIESFPREQYENHFDIIIWNFPCVRMPRGADGQVEEIEINRKLLRDFFLNCLYLLKKGKSEGKDASSYPGEIHITHKTIEPFSWWGLVGIAKDCGFECRGRLVFDKYLYPGYVNKKVLDNKSFPLHDARTYVFSPRVIFEERLEQGKAESNRCSCRLFDDPKVLSLSDQTVIERAEKAVMIAISGARRTSSDAFRIAGVKRQKIMGSKANKHSK